MSPDLIRGKLYVVPLLHLLLLLPDLLDDDEDELATVAAEPIVRRKSAVSVFTIFLI